MLGSAEVDTGLFAEDEGRRELRAVLRAFFREACPQVRVREQAASPRGHDEALWRRLAKEVGVQGLALPEQYGGAGFSFAELAVALEEAGRVLCSAPLLSTVVLAGTLLLESGDEAACARYLPGIADGSLTATVAGVVAAADVRAEAVRGGWSLRGSADLVLDGQGADVALVAAQTADGQRLFACEPTPDDCSRTPRRVLDETRRMALLEFRGTAAAPVGAPTDVPRLLAAVRDRGLVALGAEQVGGVDHILGATVEYVSQRRQFGRPIGSFQAVKHRLADLLVDLEAARSAAAYATACAVGASAAPLAAAVIPPSEDANLSPAASGDASADLPLAASVAATVCSGAYHRATAEYVQLHGGIGFTWEHPAHLYLRRARADEVLLGTAAWHRRRIAGLLTADALSQ